MIATAGALPRGPHKASYRCGTCSTPSYQPVIERDGMGALRPSGRYRCTGCRMVFSNLREWASAPPGGALAPAPA